MNKTVHQIGRVLLGVVIAALLSWGYTELGLRGWFSFSTSFLSASDRLRDVIGMVAFALIFSGALMYGAIATFIAPTAKLFQILAGGVIAFVLLLPYGSLEGVFLPLIPAFISGACMLAAYVGQRIALKVKPRRA